MLRDYDDQDSDKGLEELDVTSNDIRAGIQYIAQALRRNKSLQKISLCDCKIDSKGCALIGEAMVCLLHRLQDDPHFSPLIELFY